MKSITQFHNDEIHTFYTNQARHIPQIIAHDDFRYIFVDHFLIALNASMDESIVDTHLHNESPYEIGYQQSPNQPITQLSQCHVIFAQAA